MSKSLHKDIRRIVKPLRREGFTIHRTGKGHWQIRAPNGIDIRHIASTPSSLYREVRRLKTWAARATTTTDSPKRGTDQ